MSRQVVLATRNLHKVAELKRILWDASLDAKLIALNDFPRMPEVAETGLTFAENALLKAHAVARHTSLPTIADDSGLSVDVLGGMPGIFSARWAGKYGDDEANLQLLLDQLSDIPDGARAGQFVCAAALVGIDGTGKIVETVVEGDLRGHIARDKLGDNGFGYDPIFVPDGHLQTTAQMAPSEKDAISHRGKAFRALAAEMARRLPVVD